MTIDETRYLRDEIFERESLPLFNNTGKIIRQVGKEKIEGLSAASMPVAMQGRALGIEEANGGTNLFAKIPINNIDTSERNLEIKLVKYPAIGGKTEEEEIAIIDDRLQKYYYLI